MMDTPFTLFGPAHLAVLVLAALAAWRLIVFYRRTEAQPERRRQVNRVLAGLLLTSVLLDPICAWWRHLDDPAKAWAEIMDDSLPIHLCDAVACLLALTLLRGNQRCAELGYLWGLSGTLQGLITPTLEFACPAPEFFAFFLQHAGVPVAAVGLAFGTQLSPQPGALRRAMLWSNVYLASAFVLNALLGTNYGFVNHKPDQASLMDFLGPWPLYLLSLQGVALLFFSLLLLPFRKQGRPDGSGSRL
jgi:hypothetical integral membrane protein (TIGR02206 family)